MQKVYIAIIRDHSGSMRSLAKSALKDYNDLIASIKNEASKFNLDTIVSVIECGANGSSNLIKRAIINSSINTLKPLVDGEYHTLGGATPLFDSVGEAINVLRSVPDKDADNVSFLIYCTTDGQENYSKEWKYKLSSELKSLQGSDRWSFVFRVPVGYTNELTKLGIPAGNIIEWETTAKGMQVSGEISASGMSSYFEGRSRGIKATKSFYTSLKDVSSTEIKHNLNEVTNNYYNAIVGSAENDIDIKSFYEKKMNRIYVKGTCYYQLTKPEKIVQDYKEIVIKDLQNNKLYSGANARIMLGLPTFGNVSIIPGNHGKFEIYIQSTSLNRKLKAATKVLIKKI